MLSDRSDRPRQGPPTPKRKPKPEPRYPKTKLPRRLRGPIIMTQVQELIANATKHFKEGSIVKGRILEVRPREFLVDINYKSEGTIPATEFDDPSEVAVGDEIEVLLVRLENEDGMVILSKERAAYRQNWDKISKVFNDEGIIKGRVKAVV